LLYGYQYGQPGKKLLFMGDEFAQWNEWNHEGSLDWHLLAAAPHQGVARWVEDLNRLYRGEAALHELDLNPAGFGWITANDSDQSVLAFLRRGKTTGSVVVVACNFTPLPRFHYRLGVPWGGQWRELVNSDASEYGGSGLGNEGGVRAVPDASHGWPYSLSLTLPPLAVVFLRSES
jgi:1,4-alpha-glucan branching enzyme